MKQNNSCSQSTPHWVNLPLDRLVTEALIQSGTESQKTRHFKGKVNLILKLMPKVGISLH